MTMVEMACDGAVVRLTINAPDRLNALSDEMLAAFQGGWDEVLAERSQDADFARVWKSVSEFRTRYAEWATLGYID